MCIRDRVEGQEYEEYAVSILVSQRSWEIKRMRMQLIPGSPFPLSREPGYEATLDKACLAYENRTHYVLCMM